MEEELEELVMKKVRGERVSREEKREACLFCISLSSSRVPPSLFRGAPLLDDTLFCSFLPFWRGRDDAKESSSVRPQNSPKKNNT